MVVMEWLIVIVLIVASIALLMLEFLVFAGSGVAGILGGAGIVAAVWLAYSWIGTTAGHVTLLGAAVAGGVATFYALRSGTWKRLRLHSQIDSTVERVDTLAEVGATGVCQGRLAPMGKVAVGGHTVEAESLSGFLDEGTRVEVVRVLRNKIFVKLKEE